MNNGKNDTYTKFMDDENESVIDSVINGVSNITRMFGNGQTNVEVEAREAAIIENRNKRRNNVQQN